LDTNGLGDPLLDGEEWREIEVQQNIFAMHAATQEGPSLIPYGRNSDLDDSLIVLTEGRDRN
jgi:hypothetical protein